jgi:hypothetical protein
MKLPGRLATSLGALYATALAASYELNASHTVHQVILFIGGLLAAFTIHPEASTSPTTSTSEKEPI